MGGDMNRDPFYITTPIYYPNDDPHLGTAYPTLAADVAARWARQNGRDVFFLTGLDEHGKKIENAALKRGMTPQELVDQKAVVFRSVFGALYIEYDRFIRTTDDDHVRTVTTILDRVYARGDIYKGTYRGLYCVDCEAYYTEKDVSEGDCPIHRRPVELLTEECYYFRLSAYRDWLLQHYKENPAFIAPRSKRKEVVNFVQEGLEDLNISRSSFNWGIPLPFDQDHVAYVWFDALVNYVTGVGYLDDRAKFEKYWPTAVHIIGKDILRFHAVIWPAMLKAAGLEPPRQVFAHGFWTRNGQKFGKSLGNAIVPQHLIDQYGVDPVRYYTFRAFAFGSDGDFSDEELIRRYRGDLSQGLGNLVQRTTSMVDRYFDGKLPATSGELSSPELEVKTTSEGVVASYSSAMEGLAFHIALDEVWTLISGLNAFINQREPWKLYAQQERQQLAQTLSTVAEGLRIAAILIAPFMPHTAGSILVRLGVDANPAQHSVSWSQTWKGTKMKVADPLFPQLKVLRSVGEHGAETGDSHADHR